MKISPDAEADRTIRKGEIRGHRNRLARAEARVEWLRAARDADMARHHGDKRDGYLSYEELASEAGVTKNRVIQITRQQRSR